jgi:hypothetical protein
VIRVPLSPLQIASVALGTPDPKSIGNIPPKDVLAFKPVEFGKSHNVNYILGKATIDMPGGGGTSEVNVIAIAQGNNSSQGKYLLVPPNSTPDAVLSLLRSQNKVAY